MASQAQKATALPLPEKQAWPALFALCIGFFMILLDQTIVAVATPVLQEELGASYNQIIWVNSAYLLTFAVPLLVTGRLGDRYDPRNVYVLGMVIFTVSSLMCGLAPNIGALIWWRAAQGLGAALLTPQTMSVINRIFAKERRGAALGVWGMVAGLAGLTGPLAGGVISGSVGWQWIFIINVPIGVISIAAVMRYLPSFPRSQRPIDALSVLLSIVAVFAVVFALQEGQQQGWAPRIWVCMAFGIAVAALFVRQQGRAEARGNDALMPLGLFRVHNFSLGLVGIFAQGFVIAGTPLPVMLYLQEVHGLTPLQAGLVTVPQSIAALVLSPYVGRLADRISPNLLAAGGFGASALCLAGLWVSMSAAWPIWTIVGILAVFGLANSFIWAPNSTSAMRDLQPQQMGVASGTYNTIRQLGSVLGSAAVGAVLQWRIIIDSAGTAYGRSILLAAIVISFGAVAALRANTLSRGVEGAPSTISNKAEQ
ncbi:DHA2 family efflux MFS transporter permease subunit [Corynebacterium kozikiae]|uniref:DHA2 family efflux MFS transporter permease subunit n=1 Tax=Corynebacterium kozikiae TaxID=2968469 RepID=UPI00211C81DB|nr:DHA2 family efflux MFS transporter permease subunit [Corynebacterium sp. 76QC2CO]MCQ9343603.1 DHA2 family efflux MFS transporter permease subunit [Corynebacterium sp. 76QC2CO]